MIGSSKIGLRPIRGGGGAAATFVPFFDTFANGLEGWSLDRLVTGYSAPILTIVRPSDSATQDIYLDGNSVDTASILAFVGSENAQVKTIYGQLGYKNLEQLTLASQPLIARAGVILTDGGKPCIEFDGVDDEMSVTSGYSIDQSKMSALMVTKSLEVANRRGQFRLSEGGGAQVYVNFTGGVTPTVVLFGAGTTLLSYTQGLNRQLIDYFVSSGTAQFGLDGSDVGITGTQTNGSNVLNVGGIGLGTTYATNMNFQELILFDNADRTGERTAMRSSINSRYSIY